MSLAQDIKQKGIELGFDLVGVTSAVAIDAGHAAAFAAWLDSGFAGGMDYMHCNLQKRLNPAGLLEGAKSVVVVGLNYTPPKLQAGGRRGPRDEGRETRDEHRESGRVADYALYEDYHRFIKDRLRALAEYADSRVEAENATICRATEPLRSRCPKEKRPICHCEERSDEAIPIPMAGKWPIFLGERSFGSAQGRPASKSGATCPRHFEFKICVDSVPLAERALAVRAGLGFIGRNHMLINPRLGCQIFLGEIVASLELRADEPIAAYCGECCKCLDACPTGALRPDGQFDTRRCINYLTIEHKGPIQPELAERIGNRLFGCDECVLACPYQKNAPVCANRQFKFCRGRANLDLKEILNLNVESFEARFAGTVIERLGLERLKRNAQICLANAAPR